VRLSPEGLVRLVVGDPRLRDNPAVKRKAGVLDVFSRLGGIIGLAGLLLF
jgi:hypothetical protein